MNMISGSSILIVTLIVVSNFDALLGSDHPPEALSKDKIVISTGLYKSSAHHSLSDHGEHPTCLVDALNYFLQWSGTSYTYNIFYYSDQLRNRDKLLRSINNYTCPMAMNVDSEKGTHHGDEAFKMYNLTLDKTNWKCLIPGRFVCDGFSNCLTDECGCGRKTTARSETQTPVFYCAQQPGCVTFPQVRKY